MRGRPGGPGGRWVEELPKTMLGLGVAEVGLEVEGDEERRAARKGGGRGAQRRRGHARMRKAGVGRRGAVADGVGCGCACAGQT